MKKSPFLFLLGACSLALAQLPTAKDIAAKMGFGLNIGNTMEAISGNTDTGVIESAGPTAWGGVYPTQELIDAIKAAGYSTVRIPVSWYAHADTVNNIINQSWMDSVKTVVDYCVKDGLYTIINIHWDFGWLEKNIDGVSAETKARVNARQKAFWTQIATAFKDFDEHVLFASANEPDVNDKAGDEAHKNLLDYHQTFVDAVRGTGGNNASRSLIIQAASTSFELAKTKMVMPTDKIDDRLMAEAHFYPYTFSLMEEDADWGKVNYYWGDYNLASDPGRYADWCGKDYVNEQFDLVKDKFLSKGIPVVIGEFGARSREYMLDGKQLEMHQKSRAQFYGYIAKAAKERGMVPITWETNGTGPGNMSIMDFSDASIYKYDILNAMRESYGLPALVPGATEHKMLVATYDYFATEAAAGDSSTFGQIEFGVVKTDISNYISITIMANISGTTTSANGSNGYVGFNLVTMSSDDEKSWQWREASILGGEEVAWNKWKEYTVKLSTDATDTTALVCYNPKKIDFIGLQSYLQYFKGTVAIDYIAFNKADGTADTLYTFEKGVPKVSGAAINAEILPYVYHIDFGNDQGSSKLNVRGIHTAAGHFSLTFDKSGIATVFSDYETTAKLSIVNSLGSVVYEQPIQLQRGANQVQLKNIQSASFMILKANGKRTTFKIEPAKKSL